MSSVLEAIFKAQALLADQGVTIKRIVLTESVNAQLLRELSPTLRPNIEGLPQELVGIEFDVRPDA